ncbi:hypothetical protein FP2506_15764 [Fulvimarina pelagi HTCC2506]|uniref:YjiS-like domain-containing protein n=1 Tax=Fulvimarina pelagi HTCC2506 TaxID=314231 RepID=Q0G3C7_9HYPH|nr:DUF1127 domain-containing protein [Fulvimarina pelagi]EAU41904.1 hypothetical protein FP2506_15764 [Fulvimarina pelagi HTCC2506]
MAIFQKTTTGDFTHSIGEGIRLAGAALRAIATTMVNRRAARQLSDLPDYLLSDVGLKRDDVYEALNRDWRCDPTYLLSMKAAENTTRVRQH